MKIRFTKAPTVTKAIIGAVVFTIVYLASSSSLPSCSDTAALLSSGGECIERQSFLHTGSGWLALICLIAAVLLLAVKYKDSLLGRQASAQEAPAASAQEAHAQQAPAQAPAQQAAAQQAHEGPAARAPVPAPVAGRAPGFCRACGTRIIAGDRFCQGCGASMGSLQSSSGS